MRLHYSGTILGNYQFQTGGWSFSSYLNAIWRSSSPGTYLARLLAMFNCVVCGLDLSFCLNSVRGYQKCAFSFTSSIYMSLMKTHCLPSGIQTSLQFLYIFFSYGAYGACHKNVFFSWPTPLSSSALSGTW